MHRHTELAVPSAAWEHWGFSLCRSDDSWNGFFTDGIPCLGYMFTMLFSPLLPRLSASLGLGCSVALYVLLYFLPSSSLWQERSKKQENFFCCLLDIGKPAASTVPFHLLLLCVVPHSSSEVLVGNAALLSDTRFSLPVIIPTKHRINYINDCADVVIRS